jgi:hypothetical protein
MFAAVGASLPYINTFTTLPAVNNSTFIDVGSITLDANGDYYMQYFCRIQGALGVADHLVRIFCTSDNMGGYGHGHELIPVNSLGFPAGVGPFFYTMCGDGSPITFGHSSSSGAASRTASLGGSFVIQVGGAPQVLKFQLRDYSAVAQTVKLFALLRKLN